MKKTVLNLSAIDYSGAGKFTTHFNDLLLGAGYDSYLIVRDVKANYPHAIHYPDSKFENSLPKIRRKIFQKEWSKVSLDYDYYFYNSFEKYPRATAKKLLSLIPKKPDTIVIHWVTDFINTKLIDELCQLTGAQIVWLMLDNAPMTGGCHYPWECGGYHNDCSDCPAIVDANYHWLPQKNLAFKKQHLPSNTRLLVFSENDYERAMCSSVFKNQQIMKMPGYFVDEAKYSPGDKMAAKDFFSLPKDHRVIFFGATSLDERRKGIQLFIDALKTIDLTNVTLLVAGAATLPLQYENMKLVGNLSEEDLIKAYQAADIFVCPSLEDSGPTMINQAVLCGTPVVSFKTGLGSELVHTRETGYLAAFGSSEDLAKGIDYLIRLPQAELDIISKQCRDFTMNLYGGRDRYLQILENAL
ncbi:glycosyltransferase [Runella aurantiaca]|uniref:Glycosyltransferase n=1 Tax=Runella aurantiaca TaxID=2282308 RepID=A0A369I7W0_9BACT|nr:glycosyltransferase [Runella aurantiaca]RDB04335.1 glycosyltransferase [Runella aurantiaca]